MPRKAISKNRTNRRKGEQDLRPFLRTKEAQGELNRNSEVEESISNREIFQDQPVQRKEIDRKIKCVKKEIKKVKNNIKRLLRVNLEKDEEISFLRQQILRHKDEN